MDPKFLNLLCAPKTGESLHLNATETKSNGSIITGLLTSQTGEQFPIIRGIPRFVSQEYYSASFGFEWTRWPRVQFEAENVGRPMAGHTTRMWEKNTQAENVSGKTIVEFGCGSGRFLDVVRRKEGIAVGIDLSQAVEAARQNFADDSNVLIVQGDIFNPPFRDSTFDGGYTIGVLHHTPNPIGGIKALARTIKPGGWVSCCVYPHGGFYSFRSVILSRRIIQRLKPVFGYQPAVVYTWLAAYVLSPVFDRTMQIRGLRGLTHNIQQNLLPFLLMPDIRWRILDVFDAITPSIATTHSGAEVHEWLQNAGCTDLRTTQWGETSVVGKKV